MPLETFAQLATIGAFFIGCATLWLLFQHHRK